MGREKVELPLVYAMALQQQLAAHKQQLAAAAAAMDLPGGGGSGGGGADEEEEDGLCGMGRWGLWGLPGPAFNRVLCCVSRSVMLASCAV
jgi:hypothetical protein